MKQERDGSISEVLKAKVPISEVAERFSVSRPTLYKYMDFFDSGETDRIPRDILEYFELVTEKDATTDQFRLYLMSKQLEIDNLKNQKDSLENDIRDAAACDGIGSDEYKKCYEKLSKIKFMLNENKVNLCRAEESGCIPGKRTSSRWSGEDIESLCVSEDGVTTVFIRGGLSDPDSEAVVVYLEMDDERTEVGRYVPEPGMRFVNISNLPRQLDYTYEIEQGSGSSVLVSETFDLITE